MAVTGSTERTAALGSAGVARSPTAESRGLAVFSLSASAALPAPVQQASMAGLSPLEWGLHQVTLTSLQPHKYPAEEDQLSSS